jgi:hypothetical protein
MSIMLTDDLRQALEAEGTPLKLVDPVTGEWYMLVSASAFENARCSSQELDAALNRAQIPNARLLELARSNSPPHAWLEGDEEDLF